MNNKQKIIAKLKEKTILSGCGSKMGDEIDGWEFDCETLDEFMQVLKTYKSIHLNFYGEESIDMWITQNESL